MALNKKQRRERIKLKIRKTTFKNCNLQEVDFTETDLTGSTLHNCDLYKATFMNSNIENVDFRTSFNYTLDPELNKIKKGQKDSR